MGAGARGCEHQRSIPSVFLSQDPLPNLESASGTLLDLPRELRLQACTAVPSFLSWVSGPQMQAFMLTGHLLWELSCLP